MGASGQHITLFQLVSSCICSSVAPIMTLPVAMQPYLQGAVKMRPTNTVILCVVFTVTECVL